MTTTSFTAALVIIIVATVAACTDDIQSSIGSRKPRSTASGDGEPSDDGEQPQTQSGTLPEGDGDGSENNSSNKDAGPPPPPVDAAPPLNAFTDTAPYALLTPAKQSADHHGRTSNAGKDCLLCHTGSGAPQFIAAGTVFATKGSNTGVSGAQVRIVSGAGQEIALVGTDASGNFWLKGTTPIPAGSHVGVRDGTKTKLMNGVIGAGSCNQSKCHVSAQPPIFLSD